MKCCYESKLQLQNNSALVILLAGGLLGDSGCCFYGDTFFGDVVGESSGWDEYTGHFFDEDMS